MNRFIPAFNRLAKGLLMGVAERKQLEKDARRKMILDCAAAVFKQKGFAESTIGDIAEKAQIAKGTIYLYFKSKADLYFNLTQPAIENLSRRLKKIAADKSTPPESRVRSLIDAVYDFYALDRDAYYLITNYRSADYQSLFPKERLKVLERIMRSNLKQMEIVIEEGIRKGLFTDMDPYSGAVIFWSSFIGIVKFQENRMMPGKKDYRQETLGQFVDSMLKGLKRK
jgi:AcrR family transcriptional regulator